MPRAKRTRPATAVDARTRLEVATAYLEVAELVLADEERAGMPGVAAGLAVLAGIAGSDAICARRLGQIHRGDDHRAAAALLEHATPDGARLSSAFLRLIDLKDAAHYGVVFVPPGKAKDAVKWAAQLVARATEELQR